MSIYNAVYSTENELIKGGEWKFAVVATFLISIAIWVLHGVQQP